MLRFRITWPNVAAWEATPIEFRVQDRLAVLSFSLPNGYPPGASWAENWRNLVGLTTSPLAAYGVPASAVALGLVVWWRTGSSLGAVWSMSAVCLLWWVALLVWLADSGIPGVL